ncbi:MAG: hypothetical protein DDT42_01143 [candidate division WS2 bacterium]|uniref:DUF1700 domain-containing protein n=1 Tax=Psychracetigena formicireducens TaxID=2986056 RepID=A0A9E2F770_PSYF1|nr:hypothetical protein [Candidatus Psychracetigena formicireducens]
MDHYLEKILNNYLKEIEERLEGASFAAKKEFTAEIRSHLVEKWETSEAQNEESLFQVISEFGNPQEIAEDYQAKLSNKAKDGRAYPPTWLVLALTIFIWPVGIILAWFSPAWGLRDKIIATLIPLLTFFVFLLGSMFAMPLTYDLEPYSKVVEEIIINQEVSE